ncbi:hypothetical protein LOTGIDRAFT_99953, partial [Lottia gigantea]
LGKDQSLVRRFMKGLYDRKPPRPKYLVTWDVSVLVRYLSTVHPLENLSLKLLIYKCVYLLSLCTSQRCQTLTAFDINNIL